MIENICIDLDVEQFITFQILPYGIRILDIDVNT